MLRLIASIFFVFVILFVFRTVNVFAQDVELRQLINNQPDYKASLIYEDLEPAKVGGKVKEIIKKGSQYFLEIVEDNKENSRVEYITNIIVKSPQTAIVIDHKNKIYRKIKLDNIEISRIEFIDIGTKGLRILMFDRLLKNEATKLEFLGSENINGKDCFKIRANFNFEEAYFFADNPFIIYAAKGLKNLIIRLEDEESKEAMYELKDISLEEKFFPKALFEIPKNYKQIKIKAEQKEFYKSQKTKSGLVKISSKFNGIDPKELDVEVIEKERIKNISKVKIIYRYGSSCNSAMFIAYALYQITKARNYKYFVTLTENDQENQNTDNIGFTNNPRPNIKTEFGTQYNDKQEETPLISVEGFEGFLNFATQKDQNPILIKKRSIPRK